MSLGTLPGVAGLGRRFAPAVGFASMRPFSDHRCWAGLEVDCPLAGSSLAGGFSFGEH